MSKNVLLAGFSLLAFVGGNAYADHLVAIAGPMTGQYASAGAQTVVDALKALGRARDVVFITHELTDDRRTLLRDGLIDAIIDQNPEFEVRTAVETIGFLLGCLDAAPPTTIAPINIHMIENA